MKYRAKYFENMSANFDEVIITFNITNLPQLSKLKTVFNDYPQKKIVLDFVDTVYPKENDNFWQGVAQLAKDAGKDCTILVPHVGYYDVEDIKAAGLPFGLRFAVEALNELEKAIKLGVNEIIIGGDLGFKIKEIGDYLHELNINVVVYANAAQYGVLETTGHINDFFIRPDDIPLYEDYVDTCVLHHATDLQKCNILLDIYKFEYFNGYLRHIIQFLDSSIHNLTIPQSLWKRRLNCGRKCAVGKCNFCNTIEKTGEHLEEKGLIYEHSQDEENI